MKHLFLIRHAKSSWAMSGQTDFDRPLNDRGLRDAPVMALRLWHAGIRLDAILSSPANRALTTATFFCLAVWHSTRGHCSATTAIPCPAR